MTIGDRIKQRRLELSLTLEDVAGKLLVNRSTVMRYEDGKTKRIPQATLERLSLILDTTPAFLMGWDTPAPPPSPKNEFDGEVISLARDMQKLPDDKRALLRSIVKAMTDAAEEEAGK